MRPEDFYYHVREFPEEFANSPTFEEFCAKLPADPPPGSAKVLKSLTNYGLLYRTFKAHGFRSRALYMPETRKVSEIFSEVKLFPYSNHREYLLDGYVFLMTNRAKGFDYFGPIGARYFVDQRGIRNVRGGRTWLTVARPKPEVLETLGNKVGYFGEWDLSTFEVIKQHESEQMLVVARSNNGFSQTWLCLLDGGETARSLMSAEDLKRIEDEEEKRNAAT